MLERIQSQGIPPPLLVGVQMQLNPNLGKNNKRRNRKERVRELEKEEERNKKKRVPSEEPHMLASTEL